MTIHQLSVFLENKSGTLIQVFKVLKSAHIQIIATTIADTTEYGIFRIICSEPVRAYNELHDAGLAVALSNVFAIEIDNIPGSGSDAIEIFSNAGIGFKYLYSLVYKGKGLLIFRTDKPDEAKRVIAENNLNWIKEEDLNDTPANPMA
jgi:hypothetical protein